MSWRRKLLSVVSICPGRALFSIALSIAGLFVVVYAVKKEKVWTQWDWSRFEKIGNKEVTRPNLASLERLFADAELGKALRDSERVAMWAWEADSSHGKIFSFRVLVDWFLVPGNENLESPVGLRTLPMVMSGEEAAGYEWVISAQEVSHQLRRPGVEEEEKWAEGYVWLYRIREGRADD